MTDAQTHYRNLLSRHYSWMVGLSFEEKAAEQRAILDPLVVDQPRGLAVDLGCGPGFQSAALASLGYEPVLAFDTSAELLAELEHHAHDLPIQAHCADMLTLPDSASAESVALAVCMGDTLTHLADFDQVRRFFRIVTAALAPGGLFILTWRDLTQPLTGPDRFIQVRADEDRIFTCFLEYTTPATVVVHDLVYSRTPSGWHFDKSSYPKLRLSPSWVADELKAAGLELRPALQPPRFALALASKPRD